jgi:hypothetical protein
MAKQKMRKSTPADAGDRNPVLFIIGAVALVLIALGVLASCSPGAGESSGSAVNGPSLTVDPAKIDFGQVKVNNVVKADFRLKNVGSQPLQIIGEPVVRVVQGC